MDDYIKREDALRFIRESRFGKGLLTDHALRFLREDINGIPAADVRKNVYADCIKTHDDPYIVWKCGNCGWIRERTSKPKFCEECGADMRGEKG